MVLTKSFLMWGANAQNGFTTIGIPLQWITMIGVGDGLPPTPIKHPPPRHYKLLSVTVSNRPAPRQLHSFPGAQFAGRSQPIRDIDGTSVIWMFALPFSQAEQLMSFVSQRLDVLAPGEFGEGRDQTRWVLVREEGEPESEFNSNGGMIPKDLLVDEIAEDFILASSESASADSTELSVFCGQCGAKNPSSSNFCAKCGERLVKL